MLLRLAIWVLLVSSLPGLRGQQKSSASAGGGEFQISGNLVDADTGQPLAHARVAIAPTTARADITVIITGDDGHFLFTGLAVGKYSLSAQAHGHLLQAFNQHDQLSTAIAVGPDLQSTDLVFRLPAEGSISGTVTDEAGEPVRQASIALYFTGLSSGIDATRARGSASTSDEGFYRFSHLAPGHYLIAVSARPWYARSPMPPPDSAKGPADLGEVVAQIARSPLDVAYPIAFYGGAIDAVTATTITLARGEHFTADVALQPVPALHLWFAEKQDDNQPWFITLERRVIDGPALRVMVESRSSSPGVMELVGVPPGHYTMKTQIHGKDPSGAASSQEIDISGNGRIERSDGSASASVSATVESATSLSRELNIRLLNKTSHEAFPARVDDQGAAVFKQALPPASYEVSIFGEQGVYLKSLSADGAKLLGRTIEIKPGASVKLKIGMARGIGEINGVALRDGKPVAGAMVVLVPPDPVHSQVLFRRDQSDSDGTFTLPDVVPGTYTVVAIENGWDLEWMNPTVLRNYLARGVAVVVQSNGKNNDVKVAVQ